MSLERSRGASTVEWVVLLGVLAALLIAVATGFEARLAAVTARGGDCIERLDGSCRGGGIVPVAAVGRSSLSWGAPGFSEGWTPEQRNDHLGETGVADPSAHYFTPFWEPGGSSRYTGAPDTGVRNRFGVIHDYNIHFGPLPDWLAYFDVVSPLVGLTHDDIGDALARLGRAVRRAFGDPPDERD